MHGLHTGCSLTPMSFNISRETLGETLKSIGRSRSFVCMHGLCNASSQKNWAYVFASCAEHIVLVDG